MTPQKVITLTLESLFNGFGERRDVPTVDKYMEMTAKEDGEFMSREEFLTAMNDMIKRNEAMVAENKASILTAAAEHQRIINEAVASLPDHSELRITKFEIDGSEYIADKFPFPAILGAAFLVGTEEQRAQLTVVFPHLMEGTEHYHVHDINVSARGECAVHGDPVPADGEMIDDPREGSED
jgi:hypothetical protein